MSPGTPAATVYVVLFDNFFWEVVFFDIPLVEVVLFVKKSFFKRRKESKDGAVVAQPDR